MTFRNDNVFDLEFAGLRIFGGTSTFRFIALELNAAHQGGGLCIVFDRLSVICIRQRQNCPLYQNVLHRHQQGTLDLRLLLGSHASFSPQLRLFGVFIHDRSFFQLPVQFAIPLLSCLCFCDSSVSFELLDVLFGLRK